MNLSFKIPQGFIAHPLDNFHRLVAGDLPNSLLDSLNFSEIWDMHPKEFHEITFLGKKVKTPRWQQAYGKNYQYTGSVNNALPIPNKLIPIQ